MESNRESKWHLRVPMTNPFEHAIKQLEFLNEKPISGRGSTSGDNAVYGGVSIKSSCYYEYACHAFMKDVTHDATVVWSKWIKPKSKDFEKSTRAYFEWITGDNSPWKPAFDMGMSFSSREYFNQNFWWDKGFIFDRLDNIPSNLMHNFLVASRMAKEWPGAITLWYQLVNKGLTPEMALIMTSCFFTGEAVEDKIKCYHTDPYDWPIDVCTGSDTYASNFLNHKLVKENLNRPYAESHFYTPVNKVWGNTTTKRVRYNQGEGGFMNKGYLFTTYSKTLGKLGKEGSSFNGTLLDTWTCGVEEIAEIGINEQKRLLTFVE